MEDAQNMRSREKLKILSYSELDSKDGLAPLLDHAFQWPFNQRRFDDFVKIDPRLKNGPVAFCAVEDGRIVGQVGVLDLRSRTSKGSIEPVGGIFGVATLPGYARRGISTALMNRAHRYFEDKEYSFSFLTTSRSLVAYGMYEKLGYSDLIEFPTVYKVINAQKMPRQKEAESGFYPDRMLRIYDKFTEGRTGFVVRDEAHMRMLKKVEEIKPKQCIVRKNGYAIFREDRSGTWIRELVASNTREMNTLIGLIEAKTKGLVYDRGVLDETLFGVYKARNYMTLDRSYGLLMYKPLKPRPSFKRTYGTRFFLTRLDAF